MNRFKPYIAGLFLLFSASLAAAEYPLEVQKITPEIYALVGEMAQRSPDNYGNNSTHGVIITSEGVVLIDTGGSYLGAKQIHKAIQNLTDQPIKWVINTGGQDHRWLGNGYFKALGATIISSEAAQADQEERTDTQLNRLTTLIGDSLTGTEAVYADETFTSKKMLQLGGLTLEIHYEGSAHTAGDSFIWLPAQKVIFSGDIVFTERALGIGPAKNAKSWLAVFKKMARYQPEFIVPGHGHVATLAQATQDTHDYLAFLISKITLMVEDSEGIIAATELDQSRFSYLKQFDSISRKNAQDLYEQLEFDFF
ncbi:MAG: MBL fold metallo-hydrolase [Arenicellales bacterium]